MSQPHRPFNEPKPRGRRTKHKCDQCIISKQRCSFSENENGSWHGRCELCKNTNKDCSEPSLKRRPKRQVKLSREENELSVTASPYVHHGKYAQLAPRPDASTAVVRVEPGAYLNFDPHEAVFLPVATPIMTGDLCVPVKKYMTELWTMDGILAESVDGEAFCLLLLGLHTTLLMSIETVIGLAIAIIRPYRRDRKLESTSDALPQLKGAIDHIRAAIDSVENKLRETITGPVYSRAQAALAACSTLSQYTWGSDDASVAACKDHVTHFQSIGHGAFAYVLQTVLMQQQIHMSELEANLSYNRVLFVSEVDQYISSGYAPELPQLIGCQPCTPQEVVRNIKIAEAIEADGRPDYLGRSASQILYDAGRSSRSFTMDPNHADILGRTALHQALQRRDSPTAETLTKLGANVGQRCLNNLTPLHISACQGHSEMVLRLIASGIKHPIDTPDKTGRTAFWYAARSLSLGVMNQLALRADVDIDAKDIHGLSPLAMAARDGRHTLIAHLLHLRRAKWCTKFAKDHPHDSLPLLLAAQNGHWQCVDLILASRSWHAGSIEFGTSLELAKQEHIHMLEGKLQALWAIDGGKAPWTQFRNTSTPVREPVDIYEVSFSQQAWHMMPRRSETGIENEAGDFLYTR